MDGKKVQATEETVLGSISAEVAVIVVEEDYLPYIRVTQLHDSVCDAARRVNEMILNGIPFLAPPGKLCKFITAYPDRSQLEAIEFEFQQLCRSTVQVTLLSNEKESE